MQNKGARLAKRRKPLTMPLIVTPMNIVQIVISFLAVPPTVTFTLLLVTKRMLVG